MDQIFSHVRREIEHFFTIYKELEGRLTRMEGWGGPREARRAILDSRSRYLELQSETSAAREVTSIRFPLRLARHLTDELDLCRFVRLAIRPKHLMKPDGRLAICVGSLPRIPRQESLRLSRHQAPVDHPKSICLGSKVSACHISSSLMAVAGIQLAPTSQGWRLYQSRAACSVQRGLARKKRQKLRSRKQVDA